MKRIFVLALCIAMVQLMTFAKKYRSEKLYFEYPDEYLLNVTDTDKGQFAMVVNPSKDVLMIYFLFSDTSFVRVDEQSFKNLFTEVLQKKALELIQSSRFSDIWFNDAQTVRFPHYHGLLSSFQVKNNEGTNYSGSLIVSVQDIYSIVMMSLTTHPEYDPIIYNILRSTQYGTLVPKEEQSTNHTTPPDSALQDATMVQTGQAPVLQSRWHVGDIIYYKEIQETIPTPEKGDFLCESRGELATHIGEVRAISDKGIVSVSIYKWNNGRRGRLVATRHYNGSLTLNGTQIDYYPSGKVKRICVYSASSNLVSIVEKDTLGNMVKKIEGRGNARKEWQYYNNGQVRKEKLGPGPKYTIHCYNKEGKATYYLEGDLYAYDDGVYVVAGEAPYYPGGMDSIKTYIDNHIYLPSDLPSGHYTVICSVRIADDGTVDDVRLSQSSDNDALDAEVMDVIKHMPKWVPGKIKKWKFVQNPKDAKVTVIRKRFVIPYWIVK